MDLDKLTSDQAYVLIDDLPSDGGSITSEAPSIDDIEEPDNNVEETLNVPLENFSDTETSVNNARIYEPDSEDEVPLIHLIDKPFEWTDNANFANKPRSFDQDPGPSISDDTESPLDTFLCLFPPSFIDLLVFQTNLYATQRYGERFLPTNEEEMRCFLGVNLMMGLTKKPSYRDYWSSSIQMRDPYISSSISRDRFDWHLSNLHLNDNTVQPKKGEEGFDKLYKLRPMIDVLSETYLNCYKANEHQSIDESMVKFKGRIGFRQFMPQKPIKRGYKIWIRADQSGYVSQFQVYTGKSDRVEESLGSRVVKDLTRPLVGKCHKVYFDNFFTTIPLLRELLKEDIYACGTIRKKRRLEPKDIANNNNKMLRGTSLWKITKEGIFYLKWMDNKPVLFASNFHGPNEIQTVSRKLKDGTSQDITCLQLVKDYNSHMGYVDQSDMFVSLYKVDRKSRKWWHRLFWHFLDLTVVNSFIIFRDRAQTKSLTLKEFRLAVAAGLIGADPCMSKKGRKSSETAPNKYKTFVPPEIKYHKVAHLPIHGTKVRCAYCSTRSQPHRTRWHCSTCKVGLCLTEKSNCFFRFHQNE